MKILLCAFVPFGGRSCNTSADLLRTLHHGQKHSAWRKCLLPVDFETAWPRLSKRIQTYHPDAILLLGEGKEKLLTIETCARNVRRTNDGNSHIEGAAPNALATRIEQSLLQKAIRSLASHSETSIAIEDNAGDFLCNFVYFYTLHYFPEIPTLFLHVRPMQRPEFAAAKDHLASAITCIAEEVIPTAVLNLRKSN